MTVGVPGLSQGETIADGGAYRKMTALLPIWLVAVGLLLIFLAAAGQLTWRALRTRPGFPRRSRQGSRREPVREQAVELHADVLLWLLLLSAFVLGVFLTYALLRFNA